MNPLAKQIAVCMSHVQATHNDWVARAASIVAQEFGVDEDDLLREMAQQDRETRDRQREVARTSGLLPKLTKAMARVKEIERSLVDSILHQPATPRPRSGRFARRCSPQR